MSTHEINNPDGEAQAGRNYHESNWRLPTPLEGEQIQTTYAEALADSPYHVHANLGNEFRQLFMDKGGQIFMSQALHHYSEAIGRTKEPLILGALHLEMAILFKTDYEKNGVNHHHIANTLYMAAEHAGSYSGLRYFRAKRALLREIRGVAQQHRIGHATADYDVGVIEAAMPTNEMELGQLAIVEAEPAVAETIGGSVKELSAGRNGTSTWPEVVLTETALLEAATEPAKPETHTAPALVPIPAANLGLGS